MLTQVQLILGQKWVLRKYQNPEKHMTAWPPNLQSEENGLISW